MMMVGGFGIEVMSRKWRLHSKMRFNCVLDNRNETTTDVSTPCEGNVKNLLVLSACLTVMQISNSRKNY
jgi:hypothetical protein